MSNSIPADLPREDFARDQSKVHRAVLQALVDTEQRSVLANLSCWVMTAAAAAFLPTAEYYVFPLLFRLLAMVGTRTGFAQVRAALANDGPLRVKMRWLAVSLVVGGAAWGATMLPVLAHPTLHPARLLVGGSTLIGMSIIVTMLSTVPRMALSYSLGFLGAFCGGLWFTGAPDALELTIGMILLFAIFITYSHASTFGQRQSARLLVENLRLGRELRTSLDQALHLAEHDGLTELLNRRAFFANAEQANGAHRMVVMLDIDHFKTINDRFGHPVGDTVLERVGRALRNVLHREVGSGYLAARLGGEEFAVLLPEMPDAETRRIVEALRAAIAAVGRDMAVDGLVTTTSAGIAPLKSGESLDDALLCADTALYDAKANGRDRAEWAGKDTVYVASRWDRGVARRAQR